MTPRSLSNAVQHVLEQGRLFLDRAGNEAYARPLEGVFSGTLGAHYRHVLDHFLCLMDGIRTGEVNYDQRRRNPQLEISVEQARLVTESLVHEFRSLPEGIIERECIVTYSVGYRDEPSEAVRSNVAREIMFCVGHAIHHYAILKLLCAEVGVELPYEFGIAPSTLKHLESAARA
jgi:hypothetical protein